MANHPSAEKRNRQRLNATERNRAIKSAVRTKLKNARTVVATPEAAPKGADLKTLVLTAVKALDRAASKGAIHPKAAARKKGRLARAVHKASKAAPAGKLLLRPGPRRRPMHLAVLVRGESAARGDDRSFTAYRPGAFA